MPGGWRKKCRCHSKRKHWLFESPTISRKEGAVRLMQGCKMKRIVRNVLGALVFIALQHWWFERYLDIHTVKYAVLGLPLGFLAIFFFGASIYTFFDWVAEVMSRPSG